MKKILLIFFGIIISFGLFAQKSITAKITSKANSNFYILNNSGNYFVTFEINDINEKQFDQLIESIKSYRGVEQVTTSEIDKRNYFVKVEFYHFADNPRYYKDFFERNKINELQIEDKTISPNDLIKTK